tara:strand:- start:227 stop:517 length:291 start_codon:yes stop_codon:yes gene_type:complete
METKWYLFRSDRKLSYEEVRALVMSTRCDVGYIGELEETGQHDYGIENNGYLSQEQKERIEKRGLEMIIDPQNMPNKVEYGESFVNVLMDASDDVV